MKEQLQAMDWNGIIKKYFVDLMDIVKGGVDFASKEVPLYLKELITYEFWHAVVYAVLFAVLAGCLIYVARWCRVRAKTLHEENNYRNNDDIGGLWFLTIASSVVALVLIGTSVGYIDDAVKAAVAPRVIIVEKIQTLIKDSMDNTKSCNQGK